MTEHQTGQDKEQFLLVDTEATTIKEHDRLGELKVPTETFDYETLRAGTISVTFSRSTDIPLGLIFEEDGVAEGGKGRRIVLASIEEKAAGEIDFPRNAPIQVGDSLERINSEDLVNDSQTHDSVMQLIDQPGILTLTFATPKGIPSLFQAFIVKPSTESSLGILINQQAPCSNDNAIGDGVPQFFVQDIVRKIRGQEDDTKPALQPSLLQHSVLQPNDILLSVNTESLQANPVYGEPMQVAQLLRDTPSEVTIVALRPLTWSEKLVNGIRRTAVGAAGGTMVGVGLIFIPTLPPPVGELLIVGGVSLLGTEFAGPKMVIKQARDSLEVAVAGPDHTENEEEGNDLDFVVVETNEANQDGSDGPTASPDTGSTLESHRGKKKPTKTMTNKVKSFGRRYVLPFLDQVVGDKPQTPPKEIPRGTKDIDSITIDKNRAACLSDLAFDVEPGSP
ncbi:expressed unknown protein [Seminavis robusta]|uniref:PDZ domain-containing protein n=1 Tax=Seminavis robusta TaxID=568900 RepID=A0A9N8H6E0_9STRA|nr:expressed unknown protein [Seminavis robusta]|eukprot:Sro97_g050190.1 n/a (450) ;mRNA; f:109461-110810